MNFFYVCFTVLGRKLEYLRVNICMYPCLYVHIYLYTCVCFLFYINIICSLSFYFDQHITGIAFCELIILELKCEISGSCCRGTSENYQQ